MSLSIVKGSFLYLETEGKQQILAQLTMFL